MKVNINRETGVHLEQIRGFFGLEVISCELPDAFVALDMAVAEANDAKGMRSDILLVRD